MATRFHKTEPDWMLACSGTEGTPCNSSDFQRRSGGLEQLILATSDGPIWIGRPGFLEELLTEPVSCAVCNKEYGPQSVWDPA